MFVRIFRNVTLLCVGKKNMGYLTSRTEFCGAPGKERCKTHKTGTMPRKPGQTGTPILGTTSWKRTWEHSPCLCACCLV